MNIYDLISRAQQLRQETKLDSVSPDRVGALCEDTLKYINEFQLLASSPVLHKIYASVSAMQTDAAPKSDLTGKALRPGQLVVIVPASQSDATAGDVYRYDGPSGNTSAWTFVSKIGAVLTDAELNATSTNPVQNKVITARLAELLAKQEQSNTQIELLEQDKADQGGKYPKLTAGFANNLVGRSEAIEAEIDFRASGGKSIEDGVASVKELRGNTIVVDGAFLSCKADAIKSVGFNIWDEQWEQGFINDQGIDGPASSEIRSRNYIRVLPNTAYYFPYYLSETYGQSSSNFFRVLFYDKNKNVINATTAYTNWGEASWIMTTPGNCAYIRFYTNLGSGKYNGDICINISHTGYRNGEYQPHVQFIREFDRRIKNEFPNGIRAFDKVYNKNGKGYILKGTGEVDMGSLSWGYFNGAFYAAAPNKADGRLGHSDIIAEYYTAVSGGGSQAGQNGNIWSEAGTANVYVKDASYTDAANFTRAMQGITLYYELAEPEILEFEEPFNLDYLVWDFGTEEMLASEPSAPIRGLIAYGFNAVDMVRNAQLEIDALKTQIAHLQTLVASHTAQPTML